MTYAAASTDLANGGWFGFGHADFVRQTPVLTIWYGESPFPVPKCHNDAHRFGKAGFAVRITLEGTFLRQNVIWPDKVSDSLQLRIGGGLY